MKQVRVTTTKPDVALNLLLLGAGAAGLAVAGGYGNVEEERDRALGAVGGAAALAGVIGLAGGTSEARMDENYYENPTLGSKHVPCGAQKDLAGLQFALLAPGLGEIVSASDADGNIRFDLPTHGSVSANAVAKLYVRSVPDRLKEYVAPNSHAADIALRSYAAALAEASATREVAARRAADNHTFTGAIHGDLVARENLTFECSPIGNDVCFDAIDNDCAGCRVPQRRCEGASNSCASSS